MENMERGKHWVTSKQFIENILLSMVISDAGFKAEAASPIPYIPILLFKEDVIDTMSLQILSDLIGCFANFNPAVLNLRSYFTDKR